jgi:hypothetical protein
MLPLSPFFDSLLGEKILKSHLGDFSPLLLRMVMVVDAMRADASLLGTAAHSPVARK